MKRALVVLFLVAPALAQESENLSEMAKNVGDYPTKFRLIQAGLPALEHLFPQVGSDNARLAFESRSAIRWIVNRAKDRKKVAHHLVQKHCGGNNPLAVRVLCCELLGDLDVQTTVGMLSAMVSSDEAVGLAAIAALKRMSDTAATDALVNNLGVTKGKRRTAIYRALGERQDKRVLKLLMTAAEKRVVPAIAALGDAGFVEATDLLTELAEKGKGAKTAYLALLEIAKRHPRFLDTAMAAARSDAQLLLWMEAAGKHGATGGGLGRPLTKVLDGLSKLAEKDKFRVAANHALLSIMEDVGGSFARPFTRSILERAKDHSVVMRALAGCARNRDRQAVPLIVKYVGHKHDGVRTTAIAALADIDGDAATDALVETLGKAQQPATIKMIMQALGRRGDPRVKGALEEWMKPAEGDPSLKEEAIRAYVAIADQSAVNDARAMYRKALGAGATAEALDGLAEVGDASDLDLLRGLLDGGHRKPALDAVLAIAERSKGDDAVKAYTIALDAGAMVENKLRLLGQPVEIVARGGRVSAWWVKGPYKAEKTDDWTRQEPPEKNVDLKDGWKPVQSGGDDSIVDLNSLFTPNEQVTAYAFAEIWVRKDREATLKCGSDDGIRVWVNKELVHSKLELRGVTVDEDTVKIKLKKGRNTLLVKVCEMHGGWGFHVRLLDAKDRPLKFKIR